MPNLSLFLAQLFNGLALGTLLALISTGLTIILGTLGVLNFAHGALFMVGAYVGYTVMQATHSFVLAVACGALFVLVLGVVIERGLIRLYYERPPEDQILMTFGLSIVIVETVRLIFTGISQRMAVPDWGSGIFNLGFMIYPKYRLIVMIIVVVTLLVLYLVLYRTRLGLVVRAGIEDQRIVGMLGLNVQRTFMVVFGLGAMAAGYAGVIDAPIVSVTPDMGQTVLVESFVVVVIGGLGSFPGAILGGVIAGEIISLTSMFNPAYSQVMLYFVMALVLVLRPQGLFGQEGRE
ncbi:MAG: branched-chain amino acid ABC transporter permease [Salinisphaera sp.]|jgi:branched-chain amino acid transport system permease protein|nr:branched-chain amino acid ABC transporter permease [Salinisphaera sp.]